MAQVKVFTAGDEVTINERAAAIERFKKFKDVRGFIRQKGRAENSYHVKFDGFTKTELLYQDELTLLTDARIAQLDNRVKDLEVIALEVAGFEWKEDYIGVESTYVQVMFPRSLIIQARRLMNYPPNTGESKD